MSKTTPKPADAAAPAADPAPSQPAPVPTHGGVYVNEGGVLKAVAGGPPAEQTTAIDNGQNEAGAA